MTYFDEHFDDREAPAQPEDDGAPPDSKQQPEDSPQDLATRANIAGIRAAVDEEIRPLVEARLPDEVRRQAVRMAGLKWMRHAGLVADPPGTGSTGGTGRASDARLFAFTLGVGDLYTRCGNAKIALEKHLIQLDNTETRGHPAVRAERKAAVVLVQRVIDDADALVEKAKKLRAMTKAVLQASPPPSPAQSEEEQEGEEAADDDSMEEVEEEEMEEGEEEEEEEEKGEEQEDGMLEEEEEEEAEQPQMPVWEPEHRLISHRGVPHSALQLRLPGVPLSAVQVEIKDDGESKSSGSCQGDGVLVVHGVKQPTAWQWRVWQQRQQQQRRRQQQQLGAPFGRFEVRLDLGSGVVNTSQIRCSMDESGVLTVFLPRQQQHVHRQQLQQQREQHQREQHQRRRQRQRQQYGDSRYYSSHPQAYQAAFDPVFGSSSFFGGGRPSRFGGMGMGDIHSARRPFAGMCF